MKISELMYDLRKLKNDHGDMDLLIHVDDGKKIMLFLHAQGSHMKHLMVAINIK